MIYSNYIKKTGILCLVLLLLIVISTPAQAKTALYVDANASDPGEDTFLTIQEALEYATEEIARQEQVNIFVKPGVYIGPIVILRDRTSLIGLSGPQFDGDGFLTGFENPVTITLADALNVNEDVVSIEAHHVAISGFLIDGNGLAKKWLNGGISVKVQQPDEHRKGISITENIVVDVDDTSIWLAQASGIVARNRCPDFSYIGIGASGSSIGGTGKVVVEHNWVAEKADWGMLFIGAAWEKDMGGEFGAAGRLLLRINDNHIENSGYGLFIIARGSSEHSNIFEKATLQGEFTGNHVVNSANAVMYVGPGGSSAETTKFRIDMKLAHNTFVENPVVAEMTFRSHIDLGYVNRSTIKLLDPDNAISDEEVAAVDLGPGENKNKLIIITGKDDD